MESKWFIRFTQGEIPIPTKPRSRSVGIGISPCASLLAVLEKNHFAFSTIFL